MKNADSVNYYLDKIKRCETWRDLSSHVICEARQLSNLGIGGASYGHHIDGIFKDGVYLCSEDNETKIYFTEYPDTVLIPQWQESCSSGDHIPKPKKGKLLSFNEAPEKIKPKIESIANEIKDEMCRLVKKEAIRLKNIIKKEKDAKEKEREKVCERWL